MFKTSKATGMFEIRPDVFYMFLKFVLSFILKLYYCRGRPGCFFGALFRNLVKTKLFVSKTCFFDLCLETFGKNMIF